MMKRIFPLAMICVGILLSLGALATLYLGNPRALSKTTNLPREIAGYSLSDSKSGEAATADFTNMHGQEFPVTSGEIGYYGNGKMTLWVAGTSSASTAANMVSAMREKIAQNNSPFRPTNEIQNGNRKVYVLDGMGLKHYYFQSQTLVIWIAAEPDVADTAIQQILEVFP